MNKLFLLLAFFTPCFSLLAARVDTLLISSFSMNKPVPTVAILPEAALEGKKCPVIYLLHGYSGNHKTWLGIKNDLPSISDQNEIIFICPSGENSWYWDSPMHPEVRYETFISSELPAYIDKTYPTIADRKARAITGLSMGGHGALWNALRHKDVFGAAGSTSGGVDIRPFPKNWEMATQLGEKADNPDIWETHTVINQTDSLKNGELALIFDCGYSDFFREVNDQLHEKLLRQQIDHDYLVRPGNHDGNYWSNSIEYQILFFTNQFKKNGTA